MILKRYEISEFALGQDKKMDALIAVMPRAASEHTDTTLHEYCEGLTVAHALLPYMIRYALLTSWEEAEALASKIRYSRPHWKHYVNLDEREQHALIMRMRRWQGLQNGKEGE